MRLLRAMTNSFLFAELARLPRDSSGSLDPAALRVLGLPVPDDVLEQVLHDHGAKEDFQVQYGHLDLRAVVWRLEPRSASALLRASIFPRFAQSVASVESRARGVQAGSWREFDSRPEVVPSGG